MKAEDRFWRKVEKGNGCWIWQGGTNPKGYGTFWYEGSNFGSHRFSWFLHNGPIPDGKMILHTCDTPNCVNPGHLFVGTAKDNTQDMISKGRRGYTGLVGEKNHSAKLTERDVIEIRKLRERGALVSELADMYQVSWYTMQRAIRRVTWKHVE